MMSRATRSTLLATLIVGLGLGFALISAGCGARKGYVLVPEATPDNPLPESTQARLKECARPGRKT